MWELMWTFAMLDPQPAWVAERLQNEFKISQRQAVTVWESLVLLAEKRMGHAGEYLPTLLHGEAGRWCQCSDPLLASRLRVPCLFKKLSVASHFVLWQRRANLALPATCRLRSACTRHTANGERPGKGHIRGEQQDHHEPRRRLLRHGAGR